jgi:AcrR family transcriptional regulator
MPKEISTNRPDGVPAAQAEWDRTDPLTSLHPTAQNLVRTAKRIILERGLSALTLNELVRESGENKSSTAYYFGNKAGLVEAVLDSIVHDEFLSFKVRLDESEPAERLAHLVRGMRRFSAMQEEFRVFFELLPHALRHEPLHARLQGLYDWYLRQQVAWLAQLTGRSCPDIPIVIGLGELFGAVVDGLAIQQTIGRPDYDSRRPYEAFALMLEASLPAILAALPEGDGAESRYSLATQPKGTT